MDNQLWAGPPVAFSRAIDTIDVFVVDRFGHLNQATWTLGKYRKQPGTVGA
jgi:isoaspartyl peptidase/L-asparaginase-like protein (Ntn-hydrolase superfamily)